MQFRILPVAVALLAVAIVVMAAEPPSADAQADALHSRCMNNHKKHWWIAENEEVDAEAEKTAFPANYEAMGWHKYKSGRCSYKRSYADCPHKDHWHHDEHHWDRKYGHKRYHHTCTANSDCCSNYCIAISSSKSVCCKSGTFAFNATCASNSDCCSGVCNNGTVGVTPGRCQVPSWA